jgi:tripartite-type tricarboxylate transporter receptor subunit TctC
MLQRSAARVLASAMLWALTSAIAQAQSAFPSRNITMVVPLPAGGTADLLCRYAAEKASAGLGQQVVVENRPGGAGGRVGMEQVLRSAPDGYTLLCSTQLSYSITHLVFTKASFDPRPLEPISVLATYPLIIITRKDFPANNVIKARPTPGICSAN